LSAVEAWLDAADPAMRAMIAPLRALALAAAPGVTEHIKWNGPSFCHGGDDRITLGKDPKGGVRAIVHRGAKVKDASGFHFADPDALAQWPAVDRAVLSFKTEAEIAAKSAAIGAFFTRWLEATA
jgi:hypothetical protein